MMPSPQEYIDKLLADGSWVDDELPLRAYAESQNEFGVIVHIFNAAGDFQESMMFPNGPRSNVLQLVLVPGLHYDCALPLQHERPLHEVDGVAQGELLAPREAQSEKAAQKNVLSFSQEVPAPCAEEAEEPAGKHACAGKRPFATHSAPKLDASTRVPAPMRTNDFKGGSILVLPPKKQPHGTPQETRSFLHFCSWEAPGCRGFGTSNKQTTSNDHYIPTLVSKLQACLPVEASRNVLSYITDMGCLGDGKAEAYWA